MIKNYNLKPRSVRTVYRDIMTDIYSRVGDNQFHASDLPDIHFRDLMTLKTSHYLISDGKERYGKERKMSNIYRINPCYLADLKNGVKNGDY